MIYHEKPIQCFINKIRIFVAYKKQLYEYKQQLFQKP